MKIKSILRGGLALLLLLSLLLCSTACLVSPYSEYTKEELVSFMNGSTREYDRVADYLNEWRFPRFDYRKLYLLESVFHLYYYEELPSAHKLAHSVAELYLEHFFDEIDRTDKTLNTDAYLACFAHATGDKYAVYRTASEYDEFDTDMSGSFIGIGVSILYDPLTNVATVDEVIPDSPAEEAGIQGGDRIVAVGDLTLDEHGYDTTVDAIRGEAGTPVSVTVDRDGTPLTFTMLRRALTDNTVRFEHDTENNIGYVRITQFKDVTFDQFKVAIDTLEALGVRGYVFDLRANPGGYLSAVSQMVAYLSKKGSTIVSFDEDYGPPILDEDDYELNKPMVVIANGRTASAGEIFTAALRDLNGAIVVGETTYGKGVMQSIFSLGDGSTVSLTVSRYNPPSGVNYDGVGIVPDLTVTEIEDGDAPLAAAKTTLLNQIQK